MSCLVVQVEMVGRLVTSARNLWSIDNFETIRHEHYC